MPVGSIAEASTGSARCSFSNERGSHAAPGELAARARPTRHTSQSHPSATFVSGTVSASGTISASPASSAGDAPATRRWRLRRRACRAPTDDIAPARSICERILLCVGICCNVLESKKGDGCTQRSAEQVIERMILDDGRVSVLDLADRFEVTTETVRRDLDQLEATGALRRVHGGAVAPDRESTAEPSIAQRLQRQGAAKTAIARRAIAAIGPEFRGSVFLDAGTTTDAVAAQLAPRLSSAAIEVVTHSLTLAHVLAAVPDASLTHHRRPRSGAHRRRGRRRHGAGHRGDPPRRGVHRHERRLRRFRPEHAGPRRGRSEARHRPLGSPGGRRRRCRQARARAARRLRGALPTSMCW